MSLLAFMFGVINVKNRDSVSLFFAKTAFPLAVFNELTVPALEWKPAQLAFFFACSLLWLMVVTGYIGPRDSNNDTKEE